MPLSASAAMARSPIGPQPSTATRSPGVISPWFTACMPTAAGSVSAATRSSISSGTGNSRRPLAASRTRRRGVRPPSAAPLPSRPSSSSAGWTMTRSPGATPCTSLPAHSTTPAISWPNAMGRPVMPPMCTKETSVPQIPHAAMRTRASRGPGGVEGMSSRRTSLGPWTRICFTGLFSCRPVASSPPPRARSMPCWVRSRRGGSRLSTRLESGRCRGVGSAPAAHILRVPNGHERF